uniref:Uncharacterized protein n=1 Tax=Oryza sativa subsp. japonica TaxID=39947 RepID=Q5VPW6_ORYSJ|nr:hypothetical protein [Oryza sativa Japonica Group]
MPHHTAHWMAGIAHAPPPPRRRTAGPRCSTAPRPATTPLGCAITILVGSLPYPRCRAACTRAAPCHDRRIPVVAPCHACKAALPPHDARPAAPPGRHARGPGDGILWHVGGEGNVQAAPDDAEAIQSADAALSSAAIAAPIGDKDGRGTSGGTHSSTRKKRNRERGYVRMTSGPMSKLVFNQSFSLRFHRK